jgi:hypothetical protein
MSRTQPTIPPWRRGTGPGWPALLTLLALAPFFARAQPALPPGAAEQFQTVIGSRIEAVTILGGDYGAAGGFYTFRGGKVASLSIAKMGGGGIVAEPRPLGMGDVKWAPVILGNIGRASTDNTFATGVLIGNQSLNRLLAVEGGGGVRLYFSNHLSLTPSIAAIYGQIENEFQAQNALGEQVKAAAQGTYVDWKVQTWTAVPSLDLQYEFTRGRTTYEFESHYSYFHTRSFNSTSPVVQVTGDSNTWENTLDADVPLDWTLLGYALHTGGFFSRTELSGGAASGLNESHIYTVNGRLVLNVLSQKWKVRWIGIGCSYFWGSHFDGWSAGLDMRFQF